jgi:competence protein ComEA
VAAYKAMVDRHLVAKNADQPAAHRLGPHQEIHMFRNFIAALLAAVSLSAFAAIDVNRASQAELEALPGVGTALSARILAERQKSPFKTWADLIQRVRGVGPGSAAKLSTAGLTVADAPYARQAPR